MVYGLDTQALNNTWPSFTRFCRTIFVRIRPETKIGRSPFFIRRRSRFCTVQFDLENMSVCKRIIYLKRIYNRIASYT